MRRALTQLGYGFVYHFHTINERPHHIPVWEELAERKFGSSQSPITREDFDRVLGDCGAVTDLPCAAFWEELMDAYPEAKVVLVERDTEAWFRSFKGVILDGAFSWRTKFLIWGTNWGVVDASAFRMNESIMLGTFRAWNRADLEKNARAVYLEHYERIAAKAEADGRPLLRMKLGDGYESLCKFLGKPVPLEAFPRGNDQAVAARVLKSVRSGLLIQLVRRMLKRVLLISVAVGVAVGLGKVTYV
jgi:hypothetical protein